jgi:hypothetical protein
MSGLCFWISLGALLGSVMAGVEEGKPQYKFSEVLSLIEGKREHLSKHKFYSMLGDSSLSYEKRMSFAPHVVYLAMSFGDVLDNWLYVPNPTSDLEKVINTFISEDNFHYNMYLQDMETLGYGINRFGSFQAVLRHVWSDESSAVRRFIYTWVAYTMKYNDPLITLVSLEILEAGSEDFFKLITKRISDGIRNLSYFGVDHTELEDNHTRAAWYQENEVMVTPTQWEQSKEVINAMMNR